MSNMPYQVIAETIDYLVDHYHERPDLDFLSRRAGYEKTYFQKLFKEHVGISPKHLIQYMLMRDAEEMLVYGRSIMEVSEFSGFSSTSRLHDLCVNFTAMSPGGIKNRGQGITVTYGCYPANIGELFLGYTDHGICWLGFIMDGQTARAEAQMRARWPAADFIADADTQQFLTLGQRVVDVWAGRDDMSAPLAALPIDVFGTNFQVQVWQSLLKIPFGQTRSYKQIAEDIGKPSASRAVGTAIGQNPISVLIPCHRVIQASGIVENYAWGSARKKLLLGMEGYMCSVSKD